MPPVSELEQRRRREAPPRRGVVPPVDGWHLGAAGLGRVSWAVLAMLLVALGVLLLASGYYGYGAMVLILAGAAGVNLF